MDGFININKESGPSSHWVVSCLKRLLGEKVGHCGTLDPMAQGVLPVCIGKATRLSEYVMGRKKSYIAGIRFGVTTDSYDAQGTVTATADPSAVTREAVVSLLPQFCGEILQTPPSVSALKQGGEPLYKKVLRGETVEVAARSVHIYRIELLDFTPGVEAHCRLAVACGQGAYIRSLAHDLGKALGCGAHLDFLERTQVGIFTLADSYRLEQIVEMVERGKQEFLLSMEAALQHLPALSCQETELPMVAHGNPLPRPRAEEPVGLPVRVLAPDGNLAAVGHLERDGLLHLDKVLLEQETYSQPRQYGICAIGSFDGLHRGHRALLREVYRRKRQRGEKAALVTFSPHPQALITGTPPPLLLSDWLKRELAREYLGMDGVVALPFTRELMELTPESFVEQVIMEQLHIQEVVVGFNFTFAAGGKGTAEILRRLCGERGIPVTIIDEVQGEYGTISSSNIRSHLQAGDLEAANRMLGYWFTLDGTVKGGAMSLSPQQARPPVGWYAVRLHIKKQVFSGLVFLGEKRLWISQNGTLPDLESRRVVVHFGSFLGSPQEITEEKATEAARLWLEHQPKGMEWQ